MNHAYPRRLLLPIFLTVLCLSMTAAPEEETRAIEVVKIAPLPASRPIARQWLVLIAIDDYANGEFLGDLKSCKADAEALRDLMFKRFGYTAKETIELYDAAATRGKIEETFFALPDRVAMEDSVMICFSGHGFHDAKKRMGFWYGHDARGPWDGIANSAVRDWCAALSAKKVLVVADSCFSGSLLTRSGFELDATLKSRELLASGGLEPVTDSGSPDGKHSVFNHYLRTSLERLSGKGAPFVLGQVYVNLYEPVMANSRQEPQKGIIQDTFHEGGQFLFYPTGAVASEGPTSAAGQAPLPELGIDGMIEEGVRKQAMVDRAKEEWSKLETMESLGTIGASEKAKSYGDYLAKFGETGHEVEQAKERERNWANWKPAPAASVPVIQPRPEPAPASTTEWVKTSADGRFQVSREKVIKDTQTGLEWLVGPDKDMRYDDAVSWVKSQTVAGGGWEMPTKDQLGKLYQKGKGDRNMDPVFETTGWWVWGEARDASSAWVFGFYGGSVYCYYRDFRVNFLVFAVRSSLRR